MNSTNVNANIRSAVRRRILDGAEYLAAHGEPTFTRSRLREVVSGGVSTNVFAHEFGELRLAGALYEIRPGSGARPAVYSLERPASADSDAPDFRRGYPSTGAQIGPAWRAMWAAMADGAWHDSHDLAGIGAEASGCLPATARNLLYPAVASGYVEAEVRFDAERSRWRSWYRRPAPEVTG